jgi:hypothetical protein
MLGLVLCSCGRRMATPKEPARSTPRRASAVR